MSVMVLKFATHQLRVPRRKLELNTVRAKGLPRVQMYLITLSFFLKLAIRPGGLELAAIHRLRESSLMHVRHRMKNGRSVI